VHDLLVPQPTGFADVLSPAEEVHATTEVAVQEARLEAHRLQGENLRHLVHANTAELKSHAREKEFRLLELKYNNLRVKYETAVTACSSTSEKHNANPHVKIEVSPSQDDASYVLDLAMSSVSSDPAQTLVGVHPNISEIDYLKKQLLGAELRVAVTKRELDEYKCQVEAARKQREAGDKHLKFVMTRLRSLETSQNPTSMLKLRHVNELEESITEDMTNNSDGSQQHSPARTIQLTSDLSTIDGASLASLVSPEERDEKAVLYPPSFVKYDSTRNAGTISCLEENSGLVNHDRLEVAQQNHELTNKRINAIQQELREAKEEAESARQKQMEREENLRDVILQYKALKKDYENVMQRMAENDGSSLVSEFKDLRQERDTAHASMLEVKTELDRAEVAARSAREKQMVQKEHLKEVIEKYKALQDDFLAVLEEKRELETKLHKQREKRVLAKEPLPPPHRRSHSMDCLLSMSNLEVRDCLVDKVKDTIRRGGNAAAVSQSKQDSNDGMAYGQRHVIQSESSLLLLPSSPTGPNPATSSSEKSECTSFQQESKHKCKTSSHLPLVSSDKKSVGNETKRKRKFLAGAARGFISHIPLPNTTSRIKSSKKSVK
jgi:hypothetical protein